MTTQTTLRNTLEAFLASDDFAESVIKSTKAGFAGSSYKVELFPDGHWRVLWEGQIGNRYDSPGSIERIPQLEDSDYQDIAGTDETEAMAKELRHTDTLDEIATIMREEF